MNERDPYDLVKVAFEKRELDKLLLGLDPYKYMTKFYPGSGDSDIPALIDDGILPYIAKNKKEEVINYFNGTINALCNQYDGLSSVAYIMVCSAIHKKNKGTLPENINFKQCLKEIKKNIKLYEERLKNDFTGEGWRNEEGRYGDLKRLSKITTEKGGLNFFPEENSQD